MNNIKKMCLVAIAVNFPKNNLKRVVTYMLILLLYYVLKINCATEAYFSCQVVLDILRFYLIENCFFVHSENYCTQYIFDHETFVALAKPYGS